MEILEVLLDPILPVFTIMAFGFAMGRTGKTSVDDARLLNRFAMSILLPVFIFGVIANTPISSFSIVPVAIYAGVQAIIFTVGFLLAYRVFKRSAGEALLLGFCGIFGNNALYVLPMSVLLYGQENVLPVTAIVTLDAILAFGCSMLALQIISIGKARVSAVVLSIAKLPMIQAIIFGVGLNLLGISVPSPINTFVDFSGAGAAPVALFALGVVLSQTQFQLDGTVVSFTLIKLLLFPASIWLGLEFFAADDPGKGLFLLGAAAPAGAMSFSLAMLYNIRTDAIAQIIIVTSVLTLLTLAALA
ncbi:MAG: AEC family transporter [Hyphomicrobiales bacterium]